MRTRGRLIAAVPIVLAVSHCQPGAFTDPRREAVEPMAEADGGSDATAKAASVVFGRAFPVNTEPSSPAVFPGLKFVVVGPEGDIWIAGTFLSPLDLGEPKLTSVGGADVFVVRLDASANPRWAARVGSAGNDDCGGLAVDADGNAIIAIPGGKAVTLAKLDPSGKQLWQKDVLPIVDEHQLGWLYFSSAVADGARGMLIAGRLDGTLQAGESTLRSVGTCTFLARIDTNGETLWAINVGPGADKDPVRMATDGAGNVVIGTHSTTSSYIKLVKVNVSGSPYWGGFLGAFSDYVQFDAIAMDPLGDVVLSGGGRIKWAGGAPVGEAWKPWITKLGLSGNVLWPRATSVGLLAMDSSGNVFHASGSSAGKLDPSGAPIWTYAPPITGKASIGAIAVTPTGSLVIAGAFNGSYDFGGGSVQSGASGALFLVGLER